MLVSDGHKEALLYIEKGETTLDAMFVLMTILFLAVSWAVVKKCEKL